MKLFNSLTRRIDDFKPLKAGEVKLYTCGPTVYGFYHLGNLRNAVFNDTLKRTLAAAGYRVRHVMNITDVGHLVSDADEGEDKLETGAKREGKTVWEVAEFYTKAFKTDMSDLGVEPPNGYHSPKHHDTYARATEFIPQQIDLVNRLLKGGFAYQTDQAIYFDVSKLPGYGALSGQSLDQKEVGARSEVVTDAAKKHPYDFAVWFFTVGRYSDHTMRWPSPWGDGFPGWHLECSAIAHATLGEPLDIHTGGVDHLGTHHPNEMAQTEAAFGQPLANHWVHNEFLLVSSHKMAKSAGNIFTLADVKQRGFNPLALRLLFLSAHYRSQQNFTWEALAAAQNRLLVLNGFADRRHQLSGSKQASVTAQLKAAGQAILAALENDLDTPTALKQLGQLIDELDGPELTTGDQPAMTEFLKQIDRLLGLQLANRPDLDPKLKILIEHREMARTKADFKLADQLRDQLHDSGVALNDTPAGPRWSRLN